MAIIFLFSINSIEGQSDIVIYHYFFPGKDIPDPGCFDTIITISETGLMLSSDFGLKELCFNISHPYDGDLSVYLVSPSDVTLNLVTNRGSFEDNFVNTCFDGELSSPAISSGSAPFTGSWQPENTMGIINNETALDGDWHLVFCDNVPSDNGVIIDFSLTFGMNAPVVPVPDNDVCIEHLDIPVNNDFSCSLFASGTLSQTTASPILSSCSGLIFDDDVWFSFTAEDAKHNISIQNTNPPTNMIFEVLTGDCTGFTSIHCSSVSNFQVNGLISGNKYYIRTASTDNQSYSTLFDICISEGIPPPPANDEYCSAYVLNSSNNYCYNGATFAGANSTAGIADCQGATNFPNPNNDIWFQFDATAEEQTVELQNMIGTSKFIYIQVLSGNKSCGGDPNQNFQSLDCYIDPNPGSIIFFLVNGLSIGTTYHLRLATFGVPQNTTFDICLREANPPANDECVGAISLPSNSCGTTIFTITDATQSINPADQCPELPEFNDDVWFKFVASAISHTIDAFNITGSDDDLIFEVFRGSCASPVLVTCYDDFPNGTFELNGLTIGTTYFVRVASYLPGNQAITFRVCIKESSNCNPVVLSFENAGSYSLRGIVECASASSTITFDPFLEGKTIELESPGIIINKNLFLNVNFVTPVTLTNASLLNTDVLLDVRSDLSIHNIIIEGKSATSMKVNIKNGATLTDN